MNLDHLEKDLKKYYGDNDAKLNTDELWQRVQPHIPQAEKKRRIIPIILLISGLLLVAGAGLYLFRSADMEITDYTSESITLPNESKSNPEKHSKTDNSIDPIKPKSVTKSNLSDQVEPAKIVAKGSKKSTYPAVSHSEQHLVKRTDHHGNKPIQSDLQSGQTPPKDGSLSTGIAGNAIKAATGLKLINSVPPVAPQKNDTAADAEPIIPSAKSATSVNRQGPISIFSNALLPMLTNGELISSFKNEIGTAPKKWSPHIYHRDRKKISVEVGGGYFVPIKTFDLVNSEEANTYASREAAESVLESWNSRINFGYELMPNLKLTIGLSYLNINERSAATITNEETYLAQDTVIGSFVRLDGSMEDIIGDAEITRTTIKNVNRINTYSYINIPIELTYSLPVQRMTFDVGAGFSQNISLNTSGYWHPDSSTEYDISIDTENRLKEKTGISLIGHLGMSFNFSPSFGLYARGRMIHQLNNINQVSYGISQKYQLIGAELGLRTSF